jgi:hypothetical protein
LERLGRVWAALERLGIFGSKNSFEQKGTEGIGEKNQTSTSKLQRTSNTQAPPLDLGIWSFSGDWLLGFEALSNWLFIHHSPFFISGNDPFMQSF